MRKEIKMGNCYFDESQSRFLTVDGVGANPNCFNCIHEEIENGQDLVVTGRVWMTRGELEMMEEV